MRTHASTEQRTDASGLTVAVIATLVVYVAIDLLTRRLSDVPGEHLSTRFIPWTAFSEHPVVAVLGIIAASILVVFVRGRVLLRWTDLANGRRLQLAAGVVMIVLTWRLVAAPYNYFFDEWYTIDRLLLVLLVAFAMTRPVALLLVIAQIRMLQSPLRAPAFLHPGLPIDELAVVVVTVLAAMVVLTVVSKRYASSAALPILLAAFGAQFFLPGRTKLRVRWFENDIANNPLSGYAQGWLGNGDGSVARWLADVLSSVEPAVIVMTLLFEVGAILVVFHRRLVFAWVLAAIAFHTVVFASIGFLFLEFVVVELLLVALLWGTSGAQWSRPAFVLGPALVGAFAILFGPTFFHPPTLAWFDSPLTYVYEINGVDLNGETWALVASDFAPYDGVVAFSGLEIGPTAPLVGAYGAASRGRDTLIDEFMSMADVEAAEGPWEPSEGSDQIHLLQRFLASTHRERGSAPWIPAAPGHFGISRPGPSYSFEAPLERLVISRVTTLRVNGETLVRREPALLIEMREGKPVVTWP